MNKSSTQENYLDQFQNFKTEFRKNTNVIVRYMQAL
jgi:hypothetical protein